ncbi:hypothetical protein SAMN02745163_00395 [Clostridium cavendishii DSM 21758]|uniref:Elp3/MiaA/NifB-like radical SAM core domain-containing protein n=1 Tax=Clostridium cavendishii DSM 21758 TaxID=1121302 RepID=A0A1M6BM29_9CLOT|nr:radical SAM protein [Clostridium cavendishii]SHI49717.1 hypothetical protein SAMN02745163_00395 [Clostridium cavendishii DSM 21758]
MDRYNKIINKNEREIVLLKSFPCVWGKCAFCDYIDDNSKDEEAVNKLNMEVLKNITGEYGVIEVINSGSCFEIPKTSLEKIRDIIKEKNIKLLFLESHWCYRNRLQEMRDFFNVPIIFKVGIESFDYNFRNNILNKNAKFKTVEEVKEYFQSVCLMVGIKGQTKELIDLDMKLLEENFKYGTVNVWTENTTKFKRDEEIIKWFKEKYSYLDKHETIEVLYNNTDFGVGD